MRVQSRSGFFSRIPVVTKNIIIINFLFWLACIVFKRIDVDLIEMLGLHAFGAKDFRLYQMVSYMFLHDTRSIEHLFFNMFALFMFGQALEYRWGPKRFLTFYLVTGIGAGLVQEIVWMFMIQSVASGNGISLFQQIALDPNINLMITIGASGSVFGVLLAFGMLYPNTPLYILFVPIPIKAKYMVILYGVLELFLGVARFSNDNVAHFAHLGGMLFGFIMIKYWNKKDGRSIH